MEPDQSQDLVTEIINGTMTLLELGGPVVAVLPVASVLGLALALREHPRRQ